MGVVPAQQAQQQLVEVEAAVERRADQPGGLGSALEGMQLAQLATSTPAHQQLAERLEWRATTSPPRTARDDADASLVKRQQLDQQAGLAVGASMQHERRAQCAVVHSDRPGST
jgi:hypothetical protein